MQQLQVFEGSRDPEAIHQLRKDIKKIKAMVQLVRSCSGEQMRKDFNLLKKMFRQAGKIRDAGNNLQMLQQYHPSTPRLEQEQDHIRYEASKVFLNEIQQYRKKGKKAGRRMLTDLQGIQTKCIKDWYAAQLINISVLLTETGDRLHEARKRIKEILSVLGLLPNTLVTELRLDTDYLDQLQDAIGAWHDSVVVVSIYAGRDVTDSQAMVRECREREAAVRALANDFYLRVHQL